KTGNSGSASADGWGVTARDVFRNVQSKACDGTPRARLSIRKVLRSRRCKPKFFAGNRAAFSGTRHAGPSSADGNVLSRTAKPHEKLPRARAQRWGCGEVPGGASSRASLP